MLFKPYYLVQAYSAKVKKQQTQYHGTELANNKQLMSAIEAKRRSIAYAASLNESAYANATDWVPLVRLISDNGKFLVDLNMIQ